MRIPLQQSAQRPIVLVGGSERDLQEGKRAGADGFLNRDFEEDDFFETLRRHRLALVAIQLFALGAILFFLGWAFRDAWRDAMPLLRAAGSQFDVASGEVKAGPAKEPIETFRVVKKGDRLEVILKS